MADPGLADPDRLDADLVRRVWDLAATMSDTCSQWPNETTYMEQATAALRTETLPWRQDQRRAGESEQLLSRITESLWALNDALVTAMTLFDELGFRRDG